MLTRREPLKRRKPIRQRNRKRAQARHERNFGTRAEIVRAMPCLVGGVSCSGDVQAAHVRSRGAGGTRRDLVPLCARHHREQHDRGRETFARFYQVDLAAAAARIALDLDERGVP